MSPQKEVIPQAAVEILDNGAGTRRLGQCLTDGCFNAVEFISQLFAQPCLLLPISRKVLVQILEFANGMYQKQWDIESGGDLSEPFIENTNKCKKIIAVIFQHVANWANAM